MRSDSTPATSVFTGSVLLSITYHLLHAHIFLTALPSAVPGIFTPLPTLVVQPCVLGASALHLCVAAAPAWWRGQQNFVSRMVPAALVMSMSEASDSALAAVVPNAAEVWQTEFPQPQPQPQPHAQEQRHTQYTHSPAEARMRTHAEEHTERTTEHTRKMNRRGHRSSCTARDTRNNTAECTPYTTAELKQMGKVEEVSIALNRTADARRHTCASSAPRPEGTILV